MPFRCLVLLGVNAVATASNLVQAFWATAFNFSSPSCNASAATAGGVMLITINIIKETAI
jgi:hypothetical protein